MQGDYLLTFIGLNLTVFVLLVSFYGLFSKNLYEALIQSAERINNEEQKRSVFVKITNYYYWADLVCGLTTIYVFLMICLGSLLLCHVNGYGPQILFISTCKWLAVLALILYLSLSLIAVYYAFKKRWASWFAKRRCGWLYFIMPLSLCIAFFIILLLMVLQSFRTREDFYALLFVLLSIFCAHLLFLILVQFLMPLNEWVRYLAAHFKANPK